LTAARASASRAASLGASRSARRVCTVAADRAAIRSAWRAARRVVGEGGGEEVSGWGGVVGDEREQGRWRRRGGDEDDAFGRAR
jgi:hypothetical protein